MKILSIFAMLLVCKSGFGHVVSAEEFRLDRNYQNHKIIQNEDMKISRYSLDLTKELAIFGAGGAMLSVSLILKNNMDPLTEEEVALLDPMDVPAIDQGAITAKKDIQVADLLLIGSAFLPLTFFTHEETRKDVGTLAVLAGEVFVFQLGLNSLAKVLAERVRPYCYDEDTPLNEKTTVYYPALTGIVRTDSGRHFRTDVLIGYITGALIGYFIPVLHKSKLKDNLAIHPVFSNDRVALGVRYSF
jgi:hypothetical protein